MEPRQKILPEDHKSELETQECKFIFRTKNTMDLHSWVVHCDKIQAFMLQLYLTLSK
jgi:hypothetical protein